MRIVHPRANSMILIASVIAALTSASTARAFMESEDQQFQAEIDEARARANDFERTLEKNVREDKEREAAGSEVTREREREAAAQEAVRREFVIERDNRPDEDLMRDRLEKEDLKEKEKEALEMDAIRKDYVAKRDRVRRVIERQAYIDEAREYGL